jgi:transposase
MQTITEQIASLLDSARQARENGRPLVKIGIDAHLAWLVIVEQCDEQPPKPARKIDVEGLLRLVGDHLRAQHAVFTCYEAGPLGFGLHRQLSKARVNNIVVRPRLLAEYGQRLKTDRRDAEQLTNNLDRFLGGNLQALAPIAVPSPEEEQRRTLARQREHLSRQRRRELQQARGTALFHGYALHGTWWSPTRWLQLRPSLPEWLQHSIDTTLARVALIEAQMTALEKEMTASVPDERPKGLGALTSALVDREVIDWHRFRNGKQVASFTGLVPSEASSGQHQRQGSITKHGNPIVRRLLVECAWRLVLYQPSYKPMLKWGPVLTDPRASRARRKKLIVALARQWAVDLWRWRTGRIRLADLGLVMAPTV